MHFQLFKHLQLVHMSLVILIKTLNLLPQLLQASLTFFYLFFGCVCLSLFLRQSILQNVECLFVLLKHQVSPGQANFVLVLLGSQFLELPTHLFLNFSWFFKLFLRFLPHIFEWAHHFYFLLQGGHLDLNFDLLLLELRLSKRLRSNKVRLVFAKLVLKSKSKRAYVSFSLNF